MFEYWVPRNGLLGIILVSLATQVIWQVPQVRAEQQPEQITVSQDQDSPGTAKPSPSDTVPADPSSPPQQGDQIPASDKANTDPTNKTADDTKSGTDSDTNDTVPAEAIVSPPSPQKLAFIKQLLQITEQKKNAEQRLEAMLLNMEETLPKVLANVVRNRTNLEGDDLLENVTATAQQMVKRYRELLPQRINIGEITEAISTNLYAKYYTEQELQDLINFYQTPTGQKAIATLPQLTKEALNQSNDILLPEITQLLQEIMEEEFGPEPFKPESDQKDDTKS